MLNVIMLNVIMLSVIMLNVIMLIVIKLNHFMLSVVVPLQSCPLYVLLRTMQNAKMPKCQNAKIPNSADFTKIYKNDKKSRL
jgi:hypothetical protein